MDNPYTGENPLHDSLNWRKRFLPHYDANGKYQSITFRLNDALPKKIQQRLNLLEDPIGIIIETENELDKSYGSCILKYPEIANIVISSLKFFHEERYDLVDWVVMPNHVHVLIKTYPGFTLDKILHSWKSFSSLKIAEKCDEMGVFYEKPIWQREYWDRFIRDENHLNKVIAYIHENPVKAGLASRVEDFKWSSCYEGE